MLIAQRPALTEEQVSEYRPRLILGPFEPGFGYTLGNSTCHILLSPIPGAVVTSAHIDGVPHEFSAIVRVKEDVANIILNLKEFVVSSENDEPVLIYLHRQGLGEVMVTDIMPPAGIEIHNLDPRIATLNDKGRVKIDLTVERGQGYVPAAQNKGEEDKIGRTPIDSVYSPVLRAPYKVKAIRVAQRTDFDKLVANVEVKPLMTPRDTLASTGKTLVGPFRLCIELNNEVEGIGLGPSPIVRVQSLDLQRPIMILGPPARSQNCLQREGIRAIDELIQCPEADLLDIRNFGAESIEDVKDELLRPDLCLKDPPAGFVSSFDEESYTIQFSDDSQG